jgi:predicted nucleic acid-binding protein
MKALIDTAVWSLMLRRRHGPASLEARELEELIREGRMTIIGPVRQELLSGVKGTAQVENLRQHLRGFPDTELDTADYELAADYSNPCRNRGIQGSNTDFLICAVAARRQPSVFTTDGDFAKFAKVIPVQLHVPRA